jgi:hypothetical protein
VVSLSHGGPRHSTGNAAAKHHVDVAASGGMQTLTAAVPPHLVP